MKKLELKPTKSVEIDWSKPQWMIYVGATTAPFVVLTNGVHEGDDFSGTALPCAAWPYGSYKTSWSKKHFTPLQNEIVFMISNND